MDRFFQRWAWTWVVATFVAAWPAASSAQQNESNEPWSRNQENRDQQDEQRRDRDGRDRESRENRGAEDAALGIALGRSDGEGARVERVFRDSPAQKMGLRDGDQIVSVGGQRINSSADLMREVENHNPGDEIKIEVQRDGNRQELSGRLETREEAFEHRNAQRRERPNARDSRRSSSDEGNFASSDSSGTRQRVRAQLDRLERQVAQIQRELENLRFAVDGQGGRDRWSGDNRDDRWSGSYDGGRESTAGYEEDERGRRANQQTNYDRWSREGERRSDRSGEIHRSSGGEVGEDRQQVGSREIDRDW